VHAFSKRDLVLVGDLSITLSIFSIATEMAVFANASDFSCARCSSYLGFARTFFLRIGGGHDLHRGRRVLLQCDERGEEVRSGLLRCNALF
jgi:hypothetical protein